MTLIFTLITFTNKKRQALTALCIIAEFWSKFGGLGTLN